MTVVNLEPGAIVGYNGQAYKVITSHEIDSIKAKNLRSSKTHILPIKHIEPWHFKVRSKKEVELAEVEDKQWNEALRRYDIIRPYLEHGEQDAELLLTCATDAGINVATFYRWLEKFNDTKKVSSLAPKKRGRKKGSVYTKGNVERIIQQTIEDIYLNKQKVSVQKVCEEAKRRITVAGKKAPHPNTIRNRIQAISERRKHKNRLGNKSANQMYEPHQGKFNDAKWPLSIVQIDHTKVDIILVSEDERLPIGRPWITVAIDVFSRMVMGVYLSLDAPSAMSVGLCLTNGILPKDEWLSKRHIDSTWPIYGVMDIVHADNAKEFRGEMIQKACKEYTVDLHWRPVGKPQFGAHIERLLGTFNQDIHTLPGTTFSNIKQRGEYDSDAMSAMTFEEFERWLGIYITKVYHNKLHKGLNTTPLAKYEEGILGTDKIPARGMPRLIGDKRKLQLDFMPFERRTIQKYGIAIDDIFYYSDVLRSWVNSKTSDGKKKKFIVRRDPRDISVIFFWDPELEEYFDIPYRDSSHPVISIWALREIKKYLKGKGHQSVDEQLIFSAYEEMHDIKELAIKTTKKQRRAQSARKVLSNNKIADKVEVPPLITYDLEALSEKDVLPFDDVEVKGDYFNE